ncbi:UbiA prenyltransferase family-domain-containing protein [Diplogelasinospora grovesii]|uniref:UbiA prenyltransferase family-domain-containing protein n=1 Tax=Diplogelasinospora grovesii TaxID=303347 RepID=A0AAN6S0M1_9PEZI|nr:UbiA prenyltransferase family-domain-containing protein [Diplogelasinospora grovesii]
MAADARKRKSQPSPPSSSHIDESLAQQYGGGHAGGWVERLPSSWIPYVQLARLSPPAALFLIFIQQRAPATDVLQACLVMFVGSFFASNAAHAWNDLVDADLDSSVARTKMRPIPRGAIPARGAFVFAVSQAVAAAGMIGFMPGGSAPYAVPSIVATAYYPLAKRQTHLAQLVLGFCLAHGMLMGSCAIGVWPYPLPVLPRGFPYGLPYLNTRSI